MTDKHTNKKLTRMTPRGRAIKYLGTITVSSENSQDGSFTITPEQDAEISRQIAIADAEIAQRQASKKPQQNQ